MLETELRVQTKSVTLKSGNYTSIIDQDCDSEVDENYVYKDIKLYVFASCYV